MRLNDYRFCVPLYIAVFSALLFCAGIGAGSETGSGAGSLPSPLQRPDYENYAGPTDTGIQEVAKNRAIVYTRLAEYLVNRFDLSERAGIGIDIGGGPGDLVIKLAGMTRNFYWLNADIDMRYAPIFDADILEKNIAHRAGFIYSDACAMPFRENYADIVISRGSYQFWGDLETGLSEIRRILHPGGQAFIGRGVPPTMPEDEVRELTAKKLIGGPKYDPDMDAARFRMLMGKMDIREFEVIRHIPAESGLNYGVWLYFRKALD